MSSKSNSLGNDELSNNNNDIAINCENISKVYALYNKSEDRLKQLLIGPIFRNKKFYKEHTALKNISMQIKKGSTTGIVGMNGAGKTTLLKCIVGSTTISEGSINVDGNVSAILALGTGFNSEFTGIENINYRARLLGMTDEELNVKREQIIEFTDIGEFIHQPLKLYSTGMLARLGFSIAAHFDPDILIIDEALAVGDEAFSRKCFARLEQLKKKNVTILFVSHSAQSIVELCDHAVLLHGGECIYSGQPNMTIKYYRKLLHEPKSKQSKIIDEIKSINKKPKTDDKQQVDDIKPGKESSKKDIAESKSQNHFIENLKSKSIVTYQPNGVEISNLRIEDENRNRINVISSGTEAFYCYDVSFLQNCSDLKFGLFLKTKSGYELFGQHKDHDNIKKGEKVTISFPINFYLTEGTYFFNAGVFGYNETSSESEYLHRILDGLMFTILPKSKKIDGVVDLGSGSIKIEKLTHK